MLHMVRLSSLFRTYHQHCSYKGIYILLINTIPPPLSIFNREYRLLSILFFFPFRPILFTCHNSEEILFMFHRLSTRQHDVKRIGLYNHSFIVRYNGPFAIMERSIGCLSPSIKTRSTILTLPRTDIHSGIRRFARNCLGTRFQNNLLAMPTSSSQERNSFFCKSVMVPQIVKQKILKQETM